MNNNTNHYLDSSSSDIWFWRNHSSMVKMVGYIVLNAAVDCDTALCCVSAALRGFREYGGAASLFSQTWCEAARRTFSRIDTMRKSFVMS